MKCQWEAHRSEVCCKICALRHCSNSVQGDEFFRTPLRMMKRSENLVSDDSLSLCLDLKGLPRLLLRVF